MAFARPLQTLVSITLAVACVSHAYSQEATQPLEATYSALLDSGGSLFRIDPEASHVRIYAFRGGKAARMGHNHIVSAPQFEAYCYLAPDAVGGSRFDLRFRLDQLTFDDPAHRAALGASFSAAIPEDSVEATRRNMLGDKNFQAQDFPMVRIRSVQIVGEAPKFAAQIAVELHGQTRDQWIALTVQGLPDALSVEGAFVVRQSDFGVKPFSVLGGFLAVQDEVVVEFVLKGRKVLATVPGGSLTLP